MDTIAHKWQTVGHDHAKKILTAQLRSQTVAHAYLFAGPSGIGKFSLAHEFARAIASGRQPTDNITVHNISTHGALEDIRALLQAVSLTPLSGSVKVVILQQVHEATTAVASALLKTLEEPPRSTTFILLSDTASILPTIMSRCQVLRFAKLADEALRAHAQKAGWKVTDDQIILAGGSVAKLAQLAVLSTESETENYIVPIQEAINAGNFEQMLMVQKLAELESGELQDLIRNWLHMQVASLKKHPERHGAVTVSLEAIRRLQRNYNKKMVLEYFLTNTKQ